jgi:FkbM family methyltransferase
MTARQLAKNLSMQFGTVMMRQPLLRSIANWLYRVAPTPAVGWFVRLFKRSAIPCEFQWKYADGGAALSIPVSARFPRSWDVALSYRHHEPEISAFFARWIAAKRHGTFFDVGANYGLYTFRFAAHGITSVAFEPQQECRSYIEAVSKVNGLRIMIEPVLLSDTQGTLPFYTSQSTWYSSTSREWVSAWEAPREIAVEAMRLDDICARLGLSPSIVKVDVEGHECEVIKGAMNTISRSKPTFVIEVQSKRNREYLYDQFVKVGYRVGALGFPTTPVESRADMCASSANNFLFYADLEVAAIAKIASARGSGVRRLIHRTHK